MNGTAHTAIGAAAGFVVANTYQYEPTSMETLLIVGLGGVAGLIPDLDIDGTLRGRITLSHKVTRTVAQVIGVLMILYSLYEGTYMERLRGIGIGALMLIVSSFIKQKHMLTISGIGVLIGGVSLQELWMILFGAYIIIAFHLEASLQFEGVFYTCLAAYISHLVADLKIMPFNKRGIKLFLPISSKEL